jgi:hypothetical protein
MVGLAGVSMVGVIGGTAFAQTETDEAPAAEGRPKKAPLTDEQRACIEGQGVDLPDPPAEGEEPAERTRPTEEQRAAFKAAAEACGIELPARRHHRGPRLTEEQRACLQEQGVEKPAKDENGERVRPTDEQRAAFEAAAEACGIDLPERPSDSDADTPSEDGSSNQTPDSNDANEDADSA